MRDWLKNIAQSLWRINLRGKEGVELLRDLLTKRVLIFVVHTLVQGRQFVVFDDLLLHFGLLYSFSVKLFILFCGKESVI